MSTRPTRAKLLLERRVAVSGLLVVVVITSFLTAGYSGPAAIWASLYGLVGYWGLDAKFRAGGVIPHQELTRRDNWLLVGALFLVVTAIAIAIWALLRFS